MFRPTFVSLYYKLYGQYTGSVIRVLSKLTITTKVNHFPFPKTSQITGTNHLNIKNK